MCVNFARINQAVASSAHEQLPSCQGSLQLWLSTTGAFLPVSSFFFCCCFGRPPTSSTDKPPRLLPRRRSRQRSNPPSPWPRPSRHVQSHRSLHSPHRPPSLPPMHRASVGTISPTCTLIWDGNQPSRPTRTSFVPIGPTTLATRKATMEIVARTVNCPLCVGPTRTSSAARTAPAATNASSMVDRIKLSSTR